MHHLTLSALRACAPRTAARWGRLLLLLLLLLALARETPAATITVPPGGSLSQAVRQLRGGDTLLIPPGTYDVGRIEPCTIPSGSASQPTTIKAAQPRTAILHAGGGYAFELGGGCAQQHIVFDGLVIDKQNQASGQAVHLNAGADDITF